MGFVNVEKSGRWTRYDEQGNLVGVGQVRLKAKAPYPTVSAASDRDLTRRQDVMAKYEPPRRAGQGYDPEIREALKAKAAYKAQRAREEAEDDVWVDEMLDLAQGGKNPGSVWADMRIISDNPEGQRLKQMAKPAKAASSSDDEAWVREMLALAGQREDY
jgi:regulator of protease activity HflC (stomatin/prohibitin superfamily)